MISTSRAAAVFALVLGTVFNARAATEPRVSASSIENPYTPLLAFDGDASTRWSSTWKDEQWWMVDLGATQELSKVTLHWEAAYAKSYDVSVSVDGETWAKVFSETNGNGGTDVVTFKPQAGQMVRIDCHKRATQWGFSLVDVDINPPDPLRATAIASTGDADYAPNMALDGDMNTRWSSGFNDDDWWQAELDKPRALSGVKLSWETAFGEKYNIEISTNRVNWKTVYNVTEGDGHTDILYFGPVSAKYVRVKGIQRGTGWGYSLFEVAFMEAERGPFAFADDSLPSAYPALILDGNRTTAWHSAADGTNTVRIVLPAKQDIGGVELTWGDDFAAAYAIDVSADGETWTTVREEENGNGATDYVFFPSVVAKELRIRCHRSGTGKGFALAQLELKGGEEQASPLRYYQALARDAKRGLYPMWLGREQEYWTIVGLPDDNIESLLGETGAFEPYKNGFCVLPMVISGGKVTTWADVKLEQELDDGYLPMPTVHWKSDAWTLDISAIANGTVSKSSTAVRYKFTNKGTAQFKGSLALALFPVQLNPVWQNGGFSPISTVRCATDTNGFAVEINGRTQLVSLTKPAAAGAAPLAKGDVALFLSKGNVPPETESSDKDGLTSAGLRYDLDVAPGQTSDVIVVYPLYAATSLEKWRFGEPAAAFKQARAEQNIFWHDLLDRFSIDIPQPRLIRMMKSNLAYILINKDGPWFKPGSRNYAHSWIRDGECTSVALMRLGLTDPAKKYINAYTPFIDQDGWVPHLIFEGGQNSTIRAPTGAEGNEYDGLGLYVALVRQYVDFTDDQDMLASKYPVVVRVLKFGQALRRERMTDEYKNDPAKKAYYGILPQSNSHEGYYPAKHSYWDDFWFVRGLKDGVYLAKRLGKTDDAAWMQAELDDFTKCLDASILAVIQRDHLQNIPGCVEKGDFDATSTAIAISDCGAKNDLPQPYGKYTFDTYYANFMRRLQPNTAETFTPYEVRTADAFIKLGQRERALAMLTYFSEVSSRPPAWNHLAEVVHAKPRAPSYLGDMPHTWVGAGFINAVRSIFAYEEDDRLVLAAGVDATWLDTSVRVQKLPTQFGDISYTIRPDGDAIEFKATGAAKPPGGFRLEMPASYKGWTVTVNGAAKPDYAGSLTFDSLPVTVRMAKAAP